MMNAKMRVIEELGVTPWPIWQAFAMATGAQFESLSKEERVREQIQKLTQIGMSTTTSVTSRKCNTKSLR